jgi:hypothetical protein
VLDQVKIRLTYPAGAGTWDKLGNQKKGKIRYKTGGEGIGENWPITPQISLCLQK